VILRSDVAVLYIDKNGCYPKLVVPENCYDEARDARTYAGPWPVVAHPPCGNWSALRHLAGDCHKWLGPQAVDQVRLYGGVLEHPARSGLFYHCRLPIPEELPDGFGGRTFDVEQCDFGHPARKKTWLYCVRCVPKPESYPHPREPTHWCSGVHTPGARGETPPGIKVCSAQQRRRTPVAFATWLLDLAATARPKEER
jgi:hypothetical protein